MFGLQEIKAMNEAHSNGKKINEVIVHKNFIGLTATKKFHYVCIDCGQTVNEINKDGECSPCVKATESNREHFEKSIEAVEEVYGIESKKFRHKVTGEVTSQIDLLDIANYEEVK